MRIGDELTSELKKNVAESELKDLVEFGIDQMIQEGALKDLPIIGSLVGLHKAGMAIQDYLFTKKLLNFLSMVDGSATDRAEVIDQINNSKKFRIKVGEKLIYVLDSCQDHLNAELVGWLFNALMQKEIDYAEFQECSNVLARVPFSTFKLFMETQNDGGNPQDSEGLFEYGLYIPYSDELEVNEEHEFGGIYSKGGDVVALETSLGVTLRKVFKNYVFESTV